MQDQVLELYPAAGDSHPRSGLYLHHPRHRIHASGAPLVYANFIASLDGRIGLPRPGARTHQVPAAIANPVDWRLYQELAAQADLLITSARYFRQAARGEAQDQLPLGPEDRFADLRAWRLEVGLPPQPDIAVFSASLDLPAEALAPYREQGRRLHLFTGASAPPEALAQLQAAGMEIHPAGPGRQAQGRAAIDRLLQLGYRHIYSIAGPAVLHALVAAGALDRLYLTLAQRLLGGEDFDGLLWGEVLEPAPRCRLRSLFLETSQPAGAGQLLGCYDLAKAEEPA